MDATTIPTLKKFNPMKMYSPYKYSSSSHIPSPAIVVIGKKGAGKSWLVRDLISYDSKVSHINVILESKSESEYNNTFKQHWDLARKYRSDPTAYYRGILILDNYSPTSPLKLLQTAFMNGRCMHLSFILTANSSLDINPTIAANIDYIFIFKETDSGKLKILYNKYAGMFPSFEVFTQIMEQYTADDYNCLVIDNTSDNKLEDLIFWYKADSKTMPIPTAKIGLN